MTCAVTDRTRLRGTPVVDTDTAKVKCKSKDGTLIAKKIEVRRQKGAPQSGIGIGSGHRGHR